LMALTLKAQGDGSEFFAFFLTGNAPADTW
jgi:hypothetical protein